MRRESRRQRGNPANVNIVAIRVENPRVRVGYYVIGSYAIVSKPALGPG